MTQQGLRQASVEAVTGTTLTYDGDWMALFDQAGIALGPFDQRFLAWINHNLGTSYLEINGAMQALAVANGAFNFSSMGTFNAGGAVTSDILLETGSGHIALESGAGVIALDTTASPTVGGFTVGQAVTTGFYNGFTLSWADDFLEASPQIVGPSTPRAKYFIGQGVGAVKDGSFVTRRGTWGSSHTTTAVPDMCTDPYWTGWLDSNKGVPVVTSGNANMRQSASVLTMQARVGTTAEKANLPQPSYVQNIAAWISSNGAIVHYPGSGVVIVEAYMAYQPTQASMPGGGQPAFWTNTVDPILSPINGTADEIDIAVPNNSLAGTDNNYISWTSGLSNTVPGTAHYSPDIQDGNFHLVTMVYSPASTKFYVDGVLNNTYALNADATNLPSQTMFHANVSDTALFSQATWNAAGTGSTAGCLVLLDYFRVWHSTASQNYWQPLSSVSDILVDYNGSGNVTLPAASSLWGDGSVTEYVQAVPMEVNSPGCTEHNKFTQFPAQGVSYNSGTRTVAINWSGVNGYPGQLHFQVDARKPTGGACTPLRFVVNRGPAIRTQTQNLGNGTAYSYDLYWDCDVGTLTPKTITVSGLPTGLTFDGVSVISGTVTTNGTTAVSITATNNQGQAVTKSVNFVVAASIPAYIIQQNFTPGLINSQSGTQYPNPLQGPKALPAWAYSRTGTATGTWADGTVTMFPANVPRITDLGMLIESASTNLVQFASVVNSTGWFATNAKITGSASDPTGFNGAGLITADGTSSAHQIQTTNLNFTATQTYAYSVYVKAGTTNLVQMVDAAGDTFFANFQLTGAGTIGTISGYTSVQIAALGTSGWYRISAIGVSPNTQAGNLRLYFISTLTDTRTPTNTSSGSLFVWGAQVEPRATVTSFMPTFIAANGSRGAETATLTYSGGTTATVTFNNGSISNPSATSPLNIGSTSTGLWVNLGYITQITVV